MQALPSPRELASGPDARSVAKPMIPLHCAGIVCVRNGAPRHRPDRTAQSSSSKGSTEVTLCDGETTTTVPANMERTRENGVAISDALTAQWKRKHPEVDWVTQEQEKHMIVPPHDNRDLVEKGQGQVYGKISEQDVLTWERETVKFVTDGSRVFHSGDELGSQIAVSCGVHNS
jgi:thiosulfate dehydrogenase